VGAAVRISVLRPRRCLLGTRARARRVTSTWSAAVFDPAFPGLSSTERGSPEPSVPWSANAHNGWNPNVFFHVGRASSLSECAVTGTPSRSIVNRPSATGDAGPARFQARSRTAARAARIARTAFGPAPARVVTRRDTVGSDATGPNTPGCSRRTPMSERRSPPTASVTARSRTVFPGSWTARVLRHGASAADSSRSNPTARAASVGNTPPACETTPDPPGSTRTRGYDPLIFFTWKVPLDPQTTEPSICPIVPGQRCFPFF
jgi:hypothetical protein